MPSKYENKIEVIFNGNVATEPQVFFLSLCAGINLPTGASHNPLTISYMDKTYTRYWNSKQYVKNTKLGDILIICANKNVKAMVAFLPTIDFVSTAKRDHTIGC